MLEARDRIEESGVQRRIILRQGNATVEVDQLRNGAESIGFRKAVAAAATADLDEFVGSALAQRQRVLASLGGSVAHQESAVGSVFHQIVDFFPGDVTPVPVGVVQRTQFRVRHRRRRNHRRRRRCWGDAVRRRRTQVRTRRQDRRRGEFRHRFAPVAAQQQQFDDAHVGLRIVNHLSANPNQR